MTRRTPRRFLALALLAGLVWAAPERTLTIYHINDTHSHLDPTPIALAVSNFDGGKVWVEAGGYARIASRLSELRRGGGASLFLHAGDMFSGTLYFTEYLGAADADLLPRMKLDAFTFGNHEFDRGPRVLAEHLARFSNASAALSANIDFSREPALASRVRPWKLFTIGPFKVGVLGLTTPSAAFISSPGSNIGFLAASNAVAALLPAMAKARCDFIVAVSHLGYKEDLELARQFPQIGLVVGGHSHTLLGDFKALGLRPSGPYPAVVAHAGSTNLVVQAGDWGKVLGALDLHFSAKGALTNWGSRSALVLGKSFQDSNHAELGAESRGKFLAALRGSPVAIVDDDPAIAARQARYRGALDALSKKVVALAGRDLLHGYLPGQTHASGVVLTNGSILAPIIARAFLEKGRSLDAKVAAAFVNVGGVRREIPKGEITAAMVYEILPFANTMVFVDLRGDELIRLLETTVAAQGFTVGSLYHAGLRFRVDRNEPVGKRVKDLSLSGPSGDRPVNPGDTVRIATFSYLAGGGDRLLILKNAPGERIDTGFIDAEVLMEYFQAKKVID